MLHARANRREFADTPFVGTKPVNYQVATMMGRLQTKPTQEFNIPDVGHGTNGFKKKNRLENHPTLASCIVI